MYVCARVSHLNKFDLSVALNPSSPSFHTQQRQQRAYNLRVFKENVVTYHNLCTHPDLVFDPNLVLRYQGE